VTLCWQTQLGFAARRPVELSANAVEGTPKLKIATFKTEREQ
jgi:hypothetical protein